MYSVVCTSHDLSLSWCSVLLDRTLHLLDSYIWFCESNLDRFKIVLLVVRLEHPLDHPSLCGAHDAVPKVVLAILG